MSCARNFLFMTLFIVFQCLGIFAKETAPIIAIEPILDHMGYYMSHKAYSLQTRLTAELFTNYECYPVARNIGLTLYQERSLSALKQELEALPKPRWIIGGAYQVGRVMSNRWRESDIELVIADPKKDNIDRTIFREKAGHYIEASFLAGEIAKKLKLSHRTTDTLSTDRSHEIWAILPFQEIVTLKDYDRLISHQHSDLFFWNLQNSGKIGKLVGRDNLQKLLLEHKIHSLSQVDIGAAAKIGRLLNADKILYGMITNGPDASKRRLDLLVVESKSGAVVNALTTVFVTNDLENEFSNIAKNLLQSSDITVPTSAVENPDSEFESKRLLSVISAGDYCSRSNTIFAGQILSLAESYYLLNPDHEGRHYLLCEALVKKLFCHYHPADWQSRYRKKAITMPTPIIVSQEQCKALADFALPLLANLPDRRYYSTSLDKLRFKLLINAGRLDEAEEVIEIAHEKCNPEFGAYERGGLMVLRGDFQQAGDIFKKGNYGELAVYAYYLSGDKRLAYECAKKQKPVFMPCNPENIMINLELLEHFESPEAALQWFEQYEEYASKRSHKAKTSFHSKLFKPVADELTRLKALSGQHMKFTDASTFFEAYKDYPIYYQGLGNTPGNTISEAATILQSKLGLRVCILPDKQIPVDHVYHDGNHKFHAEKILQAVRFAFNETFPKDGILMLCVTMDMIYLDKEKNNLPMGYSSLPELGSIGVFSGGFFQQSGLSKILAVITARLVLLHSLRMPHECANFPCMFASLKAGRAQELDFQVCSQCAEKLKDANPKRGTMRFGKKSWLNYCRDADIEAFKKYRQQFNNEIKK